MSSTITLVLFVLVLLLVAGGGLAFLILVVRPYTSRSAEAAAEAAPTQYATCPKCASNEALPIAWTWWGGALGPRLLTHVKCATCGTAYNGKTGGLNTTAIVAYSIATLVIVYGVITLGAGLLRL